MNETRILDVLVVYTNAIASSASSNKYIKSPFQLSKSRAHYDQAYAYLLETCAENGLHAAFTTANDILGGGLASCYWVYRNKCWEKVNKTCYSELIFDKLSPIRKSQKEIIKLLFSNPRVNSFNSKELFGLFFDKQKTHDRLKNFSIPTVQVRDDNKQSITSSLAKIRTLIDAHPNADDFSGKIVIKDRFGSGGNKVFLVEGLDAKQEIEEIVNKYSNTSFILQPFADFRTGYLFKNKVGLTDIRIIYLGQKPVQAYVRIASNHDFRCNEHQGGELHYIRFNEVPARVRKFAKQVVEKLNSKNELYALDLVVSDKGNVYLMEGNIRPGIDWNLSIKKNEMMAKKLIRLIVDEFINRTVLVLPKVTPTVQSQTLGVYLG